MTPAAPFLVALLALFANQVAGPSPLRSRSAVPVPPGGSLRFFGNGVGDIDRVKIRLDDPGTVRPGPPADLGAEDLTIEFWMKASADENVAGAVFCGPSNGWISGNIVLDRDRYNQGRNFGVSIAGGVVVFGVMDAFGSALTICGTVDVLDSTWHHVALQRRRLDGWMELFVDGVLDASGDGPDGDVSYPDDGMPGNYCGGPCTGSDPFLVIGAEKHDAGSAYPSYSGFFDELRLSNILRYPAAGFARPQAPFLPDAATVGLYPCDEGAGNVVHDISAAPGGPSHGERRFGGQPAGPLWSSETPF